MSTQRTRAQARAILDQFKRSGLTQRAFAKQIGISKNTLSFWVRREKQSAASTGALVPIDVVAREPTGFELEVDGAVLRIPGDVSAEQWRTLREGLFS